MNTQHLAAWCAASLLLCAATLPGIARADTDDACTVLTAAQVGTAVGTPVGTGTHVTPTFVRTCSWNASGASNVKVVTLYLQSAAAYDGGKRMAAGMATAGAGVKPAAVGDDAYYFVAGTQVGLLVKKGSASFKVTVYATLPVEQKEAMELTLAKEALAKL